MMLLVDTDGPDKANPPAVGAVDQDSAPDNCPETTDTMIARQRPEIPYGMLLRIAPMERA